MAGARGERAMRPFWLHQVAEYVIGIVLLAQGLQMPDPLVPAIAGLVVLFNAAITRGPVSAFRFVGRRTHRVADLVVIGMIVALALQPWMSVDNATRGMMLVIAAVLGVVWYYTDFAEKVERRDRRLRTAGPRSEEVGRSAGRVAGNLVNQWRRRQDD